MRQMEVCKQGNILNLPLGITFDLGCSYVSMMNKNTKDIQVLFWSC